MFCLLLFFAQLLRLDKRKEKGKEMRGERMQHAFVLRSAKPSQATPKQGNIFSLQRKLLMGFSVNSVAFILQGLYLYKNGKLICNKYVYDLLYLLEIL
jgi:hypothetical protein